MAIIVEEKFDSPVIQTGPRAFAERRYLVLDTDDPQEARDELLDQTPDVFDGLPRRDARVEPLAPGAWDGEVIYAAEEIGFSPPPATGESVFFFDTGGATQRITQSLATIGSHAPPGDSAPDFKGAIGVTDDGVEGVDIVIPQPTFTETHYLPDATVTLAYKNTLIDLTGRVNSAAFRGRQAGEVLFLGAQGTRRGAPGSGADWEVSFRFAVSRNRTGISVGDITGINKKGWEHLWVRYEDKVDAGVMVKRPAAAYVERVYEDGSFAGLGI